MKRIMVMTFGSRGDTQPFLALSVGLKKTGHTVLATCNEEQVGLFEQMGIDARGVHFDFSDFIASSPKMQKAMSTGDAETLNTAVAYKVLDEYEASLMAIWTVAQEFKPDILLPGLAFDFYTAQAISQILQIPVVYCPLSVQATLVPSKQVTTDVGEPCSHFAAALAGLKALQFMVYSKMAKIVRGKLGAELGDDPLFGDSYKHMISEWVAPSAIVLLQNSEIVRSMPTDFPDCYLSRLHQTGFWIVGKDLQEQQGGRSDSNWGGGSIDALKQFVAASSEAPVYIGWGSMLAISADHMAALAVGALKKAGLRGIVLGGWAKLHAGLLKTPDLIAYAQEAVIFVDSAPHEWLFPQCLVTVHHGGMGTTVAALRSGVPTIITPTIYDQFDNAKLAQDSGAGIGMPAFKKVTANTLGDALIRATSDDAMRARAKELGASLRAEDGVAKAMRALDTFVEQELNTDKWMEAHKEVLRRRAEKPVGTLRWFSRMYGRSTPFDYLS